MALINKYTLETLAQDQEGVMYVEKEETTRMFGIPLFQHILNTTNQELIAKFAVKNSQSKPIGFNKQKEETNENQD